MTIFKSFFLIFFISYLVNFAGFIIDKCLKKKNVYIRSVLGFSFFIIFINFLYFGLNLDLKTIRILLIFFIILAHVVFFEKSFIIDFFASFKLSLLIIFFYLTLAFFYGEQFYIFRGNHYDTINYTGMSLIASLYSHNEIISLLNSRIFSTTPYLLDFANRILTDRPMTSVFIGLFYLPSFIDLYLVNYLLKIFFISLIPSSVTFFFEKSQLLISRSNVFLISQIFVFSFFIFYISEIDAYSQLSVFAISLIFISLILFNFNVHKLECKNLFYIVIISSSFFLLYPEQAFIYFFFSAIFIIFYNFKYLKNLNLFYNIFFFLFFFLILTYLGGAYIYNFLLNQFNLVTDAIPEWWGYFGAYVLGAKNIIINSEHVLEIKKYLNNHSHFETLKYIHLLNTENFGFFYFLNIFPSLFGVYYINGLNFLNIYIIHFLNIVVAISIFVFILFNTKKFIFEKNILYSFYKYLFLFIFFIFILIFLKSSYWLAIKLFFYFSFFIFLLTIIKFEKKSIKLNFLLIFFIILFPVYKFSTFNHGIGNYDSFPSVLKKDLKIENNLVVTKEMIAECQTINIVRKDMTLDKFFAAKLIYYKIDFQFIDKANNKKCEI